MLIDSLSLLFSYTAFINEFEAALLLGAICLLINMLTPQPLRQWQIRRSGSLYAYLQSAWLGQAPLKDAFWPFFVLFNAALFYNDYRAMAGTFTIASWTTVHIMLAIPLIYWTGAVWRCSDKCSGRIWSTLARFLTVAAYLDFGLRWVIREYYPQILFNCQQMIIEWGDCLLR